jgi:hypothetical protein
VSGETIPVLLTVEEAGELLRIGRTKAYAMAREWRETDGRSGLPVIDLGHVLRVPRQALEELIGADLSIEIAETRLERDPVVPPTKLPRRQPSEPVAEEPVRPSPATRTRSGRNRIANQLDLFDSRPRSD